MQNAARHQDTARSETVVPFPAPGSSRWPDPVSGDTGEFEALLGCHALRRRCLRSKQYLFRAGQPCSALYLVHAGVLKTSITSEDGREKITGFRFRGDLLGTDALGLSRYTCDAVSLDLSSVWELPYPQLFRQPGFQDRVMTALAADVRRDWSWMLTVGTLSAEQRVAAFLLDLSTRMSELGFSGERLLLRMSRAEVGNFLALQLETVTRALSNLDAQGLIAVERREIAIRDPAGLRALLACPR